MNETIQRLKRLIARLNLEFAEYADKMNDPEAYMSDRVHWTNQMSDLGDSISYYEGLLAISVKRSKS